MNLNCIVCFLVEGTLTTFFLPLLPLRKVVKDNSKQLKIVTDFTVGKELFYLSFKNG